MRALLLTLTMCLFVLPANAKYSGGTGEPNDPYQIATAADLIALGETPEDYGKHFILTADIDLDPNLPGRKVFAKAVIAPEAWPEAPFTGVFEGRGHTISNLTIIPGYIDHYGVFGLLESSAVVKDTKVVDVNIAGLTIYESRSSGRQYNWYKFDAAGGLAGRNSGTVIRCSSTGLISGSGVIGGIVGENSGLVIQCHSTGSTIQGPDKSGGLVGDNSGAVIDCNAVGVTVTGGRIGLGVGRTAGTVGGLVGYNLGFVSGCYSTGDVRDTWEAGGLVGQNDGTVTNSYSSVAVTADSNTAGGLVGWNNGTVAHCYSTGKVEGWPEGGGLLGRRWGYPECGTVSNSFWDIETTGQTESVGGRGETTAGMKDIRTYRDAGWDFADKTEDGTSDFWHMGDGGYPVLAVFNGFAPPQLRGLGTPEKPYLISNSKELGAIAHYSPFTHYRLTVSIDANNIRWATGVIPWFAGTFEGANHTISHLEIHGGSCLGLFGHLTSGANIRRVGIVDANIVGTSEAIGCLAGSSYDGVLTRCYSTGEVRGNSSVGGLVGGNIGRYWDSFLSIAKISDCYSTAVVTGFDNVGGLVGRNHNATLTQCYSAGQVDGNESVGGLAGVNQAGLYGGDPFRASLAKITDCYSTAAVRGCENVGGLVGDNSGFVGRCYSTGRATPSCQDSWYVGALVGRPTNWYGTSCSFWDLNTSGPLGPPDSGYPKWPEQWSQQHGTGRTTEAMRLMSTYLGCQWDFLKRTPDCASATWYIREYRDYPRLVWELEQQARLPSPEDGTEDVSQPLTLSWCPGGPRLQHDVYFGADRAAVADATTQDMGVYRGRQPPEVTSDDPCELEPGRTYYWRVDEVNEADPNIVDKGEVWTFTLRDFRIVLVIDDFESYSRYRGDYYDVWPCVGGTFGPGFGETGGHWGGKCICIECANGSPLCSEVQRTWPTPQDWTIGGADALTLYFRSWGDRGRLYVRLEDSTESRVEVVRPDARMLATREWQRWDIGLADLRTATVDLTKVQKMLIGVGDPNQQTGTGLAIELDDICLTKRIP
ncbi:MAG: hypothetical protein JW955_02760 [Sedimentisphaerales bacterium]|nr:hypothetical protein [Sedimentisphaerales bacterium]